MLPHLTIIYDFHHVKVVSPTTNRMAYTGNALRNRSPTTNILIIIISILRYN